MKSQFLVPLRGHPHADTLERALTILRVIASEIRIERIYNLYQALSRSCYHHVIIEQLVSLNQGERKKLEH